MERTWKPNVEISPSCPRCGSSNTKFCYYNNYSLTQPRYFCKGCRRYWTKGGSLRNVPVGGGCRKNRRGKSVRLSTDVAGGVSSKSLGYVGTGSSENGSGNFVGNSSSSTNNNSSIMQQQDGSHIDLALVYANFLNQQPEPKPAGSFEMPELPEFDPSVEFSSMVSTNLETRVQLPDENYNGLVGSLSFSDLSAAAAEAHLIRDNDQIYYNNVVQDHGIQLRSSTTREASNNIQAAVLPPLPSEEILWLNTQMMMNQSLQEAGAAAQEPILGGHENLAQDPNNLLFGNWSPFDFSSDDTFSKT